MSAITPPSPITPQASTPLSSPPSLISSSPTATAVTRVATSALGASTTSKSLGAIILGRVGTVALGAAGVAGMVTMCALYGIFCATGLFACSTLFVRARLVTEEDRWDIMEKLINTAIRIEDYTLTQK